MKNIFSTDVTNGEEQTKLDGACFLASTVSPLLQQQLDALGEEADQLEQRASVPFWMTVIQWIFGMLALICIVSIARADVTVQQAYHNAPLVFYAGGVSLIAYGILWAYSRSKRKSAAAQVDTDVMERRALLLAKSAREELGVPEDAAEVDVLARTYTFKDGKAKKHGMYLWDYINESLYVYRSGEDLCFADSYHVFSVPVSSIEAIYQIPKKVGLMKWNKDVPLKSRDYRPYKVYENNGTIYVNPYFLLSVRHSLGEYAILIPCYDIETVRALTGLEIQTDPDKKILEMCRDV